MPDSPSAAFISYSRADSEFALRLATDLKAAGASVWLDQLDIQPGQPWDDEIERALLGARHMILILSPASAQSRNVRDEVSFALGQGKVVVPVLYADCVVPLRLQRQHRIDFRADYSRGLAALLDHLRVEKPDWTVLKEAADAEAQRKAAWRARELAAARLHQEMGKDELNMALAPEQSGGSAPRPATRPIHYVERPADRRFQEALDRGESIILIRCLHQAGKTWMLARGLDHARKAGKRVVVADLQKFGESDFETLESFCRAFGSFIGDQLDLHVSLESVWRPSLGAGLNLERYLNRYILAQAANGLVLAVDELDRLFPREYCSEVFGLFRSWHNERAISPQSPMTWLTLVLLFTSMRHLLIQPTSNQSPFNVGTNIELRDFGPSEIAELAALRGIALRANDVERLYDLLGGNPALVSCGLDVLETSPDIDHLAKIAGSDEGPFADHLRQMLLEVEGNAKMAEAIKALLQQQPISDRSSCFALIDAGIVVGSSPQDARFRAGIYRIYLSRHLLGTPSHSSA